MCRQYYSRQNDGITVTNKIKYKLLEISGWSDNPFFYPVPVSVIADGYPVGQREGTSTKCTAYRYPAFGLARYSATDGRKNQFSVRPCKKRAHSLVRIKKVTGNGTTILKKICL